MRPNLNNASLKISAGVPKQFPADRLPQIAFSGRSNVGKSSLINSLLGRKSLARVSGEPGKTITINFYDIDKKLYLVDLPGYGYAKRCKSQQEKLKDIISDYILGREQMTLLFLLVDSRHEPQKIDLEFIEWLGENGVPFSIVFTKADKLTRAQLNTNIEAYKAQLLEQWEELPTMFVTSSDRAIGRTELLNYIDEINKSL